MDYTVKIKEKEVLQLLLSVCFQIIFLHFDLEIDVLAFKMTLNHENSIRNGIPSQKYTRKRYYTFSQLY